MSEAYSAIARWYDVLGDTVDYEAWADFLASFLPAGGSVLDLACGTGNMTLPLARRGFDMIGTDLSCEMLALAREKAVAQGKDILFLQQNMTCLDLYGTVDGAVCTLDGVNYLSDENELLACFSSVAKFLSPGAHFIFDVNTPYKFENIYGDNHYVLEDEGVFLAWRNEYDAVSGACDFYLDVFSLREDGGYDRECEDQTEYCHSMERLLHVAKECGFTPVGVYGDFDLTPAADTDERWYFVLKKEDNNG